MVHIHKYRRVKIGKKRDYTVYKCALNCSHYITPDLIRDRKSICWACGKEFVIQVKHTRQVRPTCGCKQQTPKSKEETDNVLKEIGLLR